MMAAEINVFVDKGVGHVKVFVPATPDQFDANGEVSAWAAPDVAQIAALYNAIVAALGEGHELGREAPRGFPPREKKPEIEAPSDIPVPKHCGEPMEFKRGTSKAGKDWAKYVCRKGKGCTDADQYGGYGIWEDAWRRQCEAVGA